ncbi:MAG: MBL fold metallo-hydrolase [Treponema sp.]|jgi:glyoxylase-like metal-dependent hydrolase (beta-lactamase superfamily II)|nr:MBL fold metallo-hydrolase [Treponema sp.]
MTTWIIVSIFILLIGAGLYYASPLLRMNPVKTGQISGTNIFAVKNAIVTVYLIKTDNGYILIDAGSNATQLKTSLDEAGVNIDDVKWILLTHSDSDHTAALTLFPNAAIYMSKDELPLINGTMKRFFFGGNKLPPGIDIVKITLLSDGQELSFGGTKVKCITAPGHTDGSMLYLADNRYLFTGDAFMVGNGKIGVHPFAKDKKLSVKTIERLRETIDSASIILTSHYGVIVKNGNS